MRTGKRSDENAVKPSRRRAAHGAGCVTTKAVSDEPFSRQQRLPAFLLVPVLGSVPRELARDAVKNAAVGRVLSAPVKDRDVLRLDQVAFASS